MRSENRPIECGLPQGAVISPPLFCININDVPIIEKIDEKTLLFADDIACFTIYDNELPTGNVQNYLNELEIWMRKWRLKLATHKCVQLTFSRNRFPENEFLAKRTI